MRHILKKPDGTYTLHTDTGGVSPKPPKYSPEDKYGEYRRQTKEPEWKKKGLV